jgi:hypothetical protein
MALRLDPEVAVRELVRLSAEDARGDAEAVLENCAQHLRINERDVVAYARRILVLLHLGRDAEAEPDLSCVRELAPEMWKDFCRVLRLARAQATARSVSKPADEVACLDAVFSSYGQGTEDWGR